MGYYKVSFETEGGVYCANIACAKSASDVEREYSKYPWYNVAEATEYDVDAARRRGMPLVEIPAEAEANAADIISTARASLEAEKQRSAWNRGVTVYALELLEDLETGVSGGYFSMDDLESPKLLERAMLNGADDWNRYSWSGSALIYNHEIAARLCSPSELKRTREGWRRPNRREDWLDVQARALYQAARRVKRHVSDAVKEAQG